MLAFPFVVFVAWRVMAPYAGAPRNLVIAVVGAFVVMTAILLVLWYEQEAPADSGYVPARLENGRIIPGRVVPGAVVPGRGGPGGGEPGGAVEPPPAAK